jgi:hypothetical protein
MEDKSSLFHAMPQKKGEGDIRFDTQLLFSTQTDTHVA